MSGDTETAPPPAQAQQSPTLPCIEVWVRPRKSESGGFVQIFINSLLRPHHVSCWISLLHTWSKNRDWFLISERWFWWFWRFFLASPHLAADSFLGVFSPSEENSDACGGKCIWFLSDVNNIFIFVCWHKVSPLELDIIYSAMLCMTHCETAHRVFYVAGFNVSQFNMKNQIQINR